MIKDTRGSYDIQLLTRIPVFTVGTLHLFCSYKYSVNTNRPQRPQSRFRVFQKSLWPSVQKFYPVQAQVLKNRYFWLFWQILQLPVVFYTKMVKRHIYRSIPFIWAYNQVSMTFRSKVLARTSLSLEKPIYLAILTTSGRVFLTEMVKRHIYGPRPFIWTYNQVSMTFHSKLLARTRKRWQTDRQTDGRTDGHYRPPTFGLGPKKIGYNMDLEVGIEMLWDMGGPVIIHTYFSPILYDFWLAIFFSNHIKFKVTAPYQTLSFKHMTRLLRTSIQTFFKHIYILKSISQAKGRHWNMTEFGRKHQKA